TGEPIEIHGDGAQTRCFCHVQDTIRALHGMMERGGSGEIYNVGSTNRISIIELADRIRELTGSSSELVYVPYEHVYGQAIEDMRHRIPAIEKLHAAIGWQPEADPDSILEDGVRHERETATAAA